MFSSPVLQIKKSLAFTKLVDLLKSIELFLIKYRCIKSFYYINTHFKLLIEYTSQTKKHYVTIITINIKRFYTLYHVTNETQRIPRMRIVYLSKKPWQNWTKVWNRNSICLRKMSANSPPGKSDGEYGNYVNFPIV